MKTPLTDMRTRTPGVVLRRLVRGLRGLIACGLHHSRRHWRLAFCLMVATVLVTAAAIVGLNLAFPFPMEGLNRLRSQRQGTQILAEDGHVLRGFLGEDDSLMFWADHDQISPWMIQATVAVEDAGFFEHHGVDPRAVMRAVVQNARNLRVVSGASTLTMQLVKQINNYPRETRYKAVESFRALQAERCLTKQEILEWYLNIVPYGGNLIGIESASQRYFHKRSADLSLEEAALLAGIPQSPSRLRPDRFPDRARSRRNLVLKRMYSCRMITTEEYDRARSAPVVVTSSLPPMVAPLLAQDLVRKHHGQATVRSCIDWQLQQQSQEALKRHVQKLAGDGIHGGSVVILENLTGAVRCLIGSPDFMDNEHAGQVNCARAWRSPGSTLKPFTYVLAMEQGIITPATRLADVPVTFGGYQPINFDQQFRGPVRADVALSHSLNAPAVALLNRVGAARLYALLEELGVQFQKPAGHYGLALTLGAAEVRLLQLASAYATLARLGVHRDYRILANAPIDSGRRVIDEGACYLIAEALAETDRLGGAALWKSSRNQIKMAWKTGTSYGLRDAWTIAYTPDFTVGVWIGNPDATPSDRLIGIEAAAPLAARLMELAHAGKQPRWYKRPKTVGDRRVCIVSGMPAGRHCRKTAVGPYLPKCSDRHTCTVHQEILVDAGKKHRLCAHCSVGLTTHKQVLEVWSPEISAWLSKNGALMPPPHLPSCTRQPRPARAPAILHPVDGQVFVHIPGSDRQRLRFRGAGAGKLYWFVDGALLGAATMHETIWWDLAPGQHRIVCADSVGRAAHVSVVVK